MAEKKTATKKVATAAKAPAKKAAAKTTKVVAAKAEATPKAAPVKKATPAKKCATKKAELYVNAETAGYRAGDIYQALAAANKAMTVAEIAKATKRSNEEILLGLGWLLKEGKIVGENVADIRLA